MLERLPASWVAFTTSRWTQVRGSSGEIWERLVKKGRHRRFEEARSLKRAFEVDAEPCPECGADPEDQHASWCLHDSEEIEDEEEEEQNPSY